MALDTNNEVTQEHLPTVLSGLQQQLTSPSLNQPGPLAKKLRMLLMLTQSLMK